MTRPFIVRQATKADLAGILQLERATPEAPHWPEADYAAILLTGLVKRCLFVAIFDDQLIGFTAARAVADEAELESVAVAKSNRRKGTGRALCRAVIEWCHVERATVLRLEVRAASMGAQQLYTSLGFTAIGKRSDYYRNPHEDAVLMSRTLV